MLHDRLPHPAEVDANMVGKLVRDKTQFQHLLLNRMVQGDQIPAVLVVPEMYNGTIVIWIDPAGKSSLVQQGKLNPTAQKILDQKAAILAPDVYQTGEFLTASRPVDQRFAGYTFGYNSPLCANRVQDILTTVAYARKQRGTKAIHLVGFDKAGPWVALARTQCGDAVARTAADLNRFSFSDVRSVSDEMMLPGALRYGDLTTLIALAAPSEVLLHNHPGLGTDSVVKAAYQAAGALGKLQAQADKAGPAKVVEWLLR
jgi:hypothetical protein